MFFMTDFWLKLYDKVERIERPGIAGTIVHIDKVLPADNGNTTCLVQWDNDERGSDYFNIEWTNTLQLVEAPTLDVLPTGAPLGIGLLAFDVKNI